MNTWSRTSIARDWNRGWVCDLIVIEHVQLYGRGRQLSRCFLSRSFNYLNNQDLYSHMFVRGTRFYTGVLVLRSGLKNGSCATVAVTFWRTASIVISICSFVPGLDWAVSTLASAIIFFSIGDHVV